MHVIDAYDWEAEPRASTRESSRAGRRRNRVDRMQADFSWSDPPARSRRSEKRAGDDEALRPRRRITATPMDDLPSAPVRAAEADPEAAAAPVPELPASMESGSVLSAPAVSAEASPEPAGPRTVVIRGRGAERYTPTRGGYEARLRRHQRSGFKPDRVALWAVLLGLALLLGAVTSAHAAVTHHAVVHLARHGI